VPTENRVSGQIGGLGPGTAVAVKSRQPGVVFDVRPRTDLPKRGSIKRCPKCNQRFSEFLVTMPYTSFCSGFSRAPGEHLDRRCSNCNFAWAEAS